MAIDLSSWLFRVISFVQRVKTHIVKRPRPRSKSDKGGMRCRSQQSLALLTYPLRTIAADPTHKLPVLTMSSSQLSQNDINAAVPRSYNSDEASADVTDGGASGTGERTCTSRTANVCHKPARTLIIGGQAITPQITSVAGTRDGGTPSSREGQEHRTQIHSRTPRPVTTALNGRGGHGTQVRMQSHRTIRPAPNGGRDNGRQTHTHSLLGSDITQSGNTWMIRDRGLTTVIMSDPDNPDTTPQFGRASGSSLPTIGTGMLAPASARISGFRNGIPTYKSPAADASESETQSVSATEKEE